MYTKVMPKKNKLTKPRKKRVVKKKKRCDICEKDFKTTAACSSHKRYKHPGKKPKVKTGRKPIVSLETIDLLKAAFKIGCTVEEACGHADISKATLYSYAKENEGFLDKIGLWRLSPNFKARNTINENLDKIETAKWYASNKLSNEFGEQSTQNVNIKDEDATEEIQKSNKRIDTVIAALSGIKSAKASTKKST